jgi:hypothetical protein
MIGDEHLLAPVPRQAFGDMRAMTSGAPPAPVVTISLTGAVGKFCAGAGSR